jgi:hypothetical protein
MRTNLRLLASAATLALAACGGGGGTGATIALADLQGFWNGPVAGAEFGGAASVRTVVLDDGRTWVFLHGAGAGEPLVGMAHGQLAVAGESFTGTGTRYDASGAALRTVALSGHPVMGGLSLASTDAGAAAPSTMDLAYDERFDTPAAAADVAGAWGFTQDGGSVTYSWTLDAAGVLSGTSTKGCSYAGEVLPRAGVAVYEVSITETCTGGNKTLDGVAKLNTAKTFLTFGLTTPDASEGMAFVAGRLAG